MLRIVDGDCGRGDRLLGHGMLLGGRPRGSAVGVDTLVERRTLPPDTKRRYTPVASGFRRVTRQEHHEPCPPPTLERRSRPPAPRRRGAQPGAHRRDRERRCSRRVGPTPRWRRSREARASASARCTGTSRRATTWWRRCSTTGIDELRRSPKSCSRPTRPAKRSPRGCTRSSSRPPTCRGLAAEAMLTMLAQHRRAVARASRCARPAPRCSLACAGRGRSARRRRHRRPRAHGAGGHVGGGGVRRSRRRRAALRVRARRRSRSLSGAPPRNTRCPLPRLRRTFGVAFDRCSRPRGFDRMATMTAQPVEPPDTSELSSRYLEAVDAVALRERTDDCRARGASQEARDLARKRGRRSPDDRLRT